MGLCEPLALQSCPAGSSNASSTVKLAGSRSSTVARNGCLVDATANRAIAIVRRDRAIAYLQSLESRARRNQSHAIAPHNRVAELAIARDWEKNKVARPTLT